MIQTKPLSITFFAYRLIARITICLIQSSFSEISRDVRFTADTCQITHSILILTQPYKIFEDTVGFAHVRRDDCLHFVYIS